MPVICPVALVWVMLPKCGPTMGPKSNEILFPNYFNYFINYIKYCVINIYLDKFRNIISNPIIQL